MSENSNCDKHTTIHQLVEVDAEVTIIPIIKHGKPKITCIESEVQSSNESSCRCRRSQRSNEKCTYVLKQVICVEIPIDFDVEVDVEKGIGKCCKPDLGTCKTVSCKDASQESKPDDCDEQEDKKESKDCHRYSKYSKSSRSR